MRGRRVSCKTARWPTQELRLTRKHYWCVLLGVENRGNAMGYMVKWRAAENQPLQPELLQNFDAAKKRVRELLDKYGNEAAVEVWNEDETWQIVSASGVEEWSRNLRV